MPRRRERDPSKERFWRQMLRRWRRSGLTIRAFCELHRLAEPSFYFWRRTIARCDQARVADQAAPPLPTFVPVQVVATAAIEIVLGPNRVVRVQAGFDAATLRQLLAVLAERPC